MQRFRTLPMTLTLVSLLVVSGLATSALARPRGHDHDRLTRLEQRLDNLDLDDATRAAMHTALDEAQAEQSKMRASLREAYQGLRTLMQQDLPDAEAVSTQLDTIGALETAHRKQTTMAWLAVLAQLTPEQRTSLRHAVRDHGDRKKDHGQ